MWTVFVLVDHIDLLGTRVRRPVREANNERLGNAWNIGSIDDALKSVRKVLNSIDNDQIFRSTDELQVITRVDAGQVASFEPSIERECIPRRLLVKILFKDDMAPDFTGAPRFGKFIRANFFCLRILTSPTQRNPLISVHSIVRLGIAEGFPPQGISVQDLAKKLNLRGSLIRRLLSHCATHRIYYQASPDFFRAHGGLKSACRERRHA